MPHRSKLLPALVLFACLALAGPAGASAAGSHGGAVVYSQVVTTTTNEVVRDAEGNPVLDADGAERMEVKTTVEGGLYAVRDGRLNQLTEDPADAEPSFSPDSRAIVFSRAGRIYTVRADGSGLRALSHGPGLDTAPLVAPSGRFAVFERRASAGAPADLYTVALSGGRASRLVASAADDHEAAFARDPRGGWRIAFVRSVPEAGGGVADDIYSVRPSGGRVARLTRTGRIDEFHPRGFAGGVIFSRGERADDARAYADVYTMAANGKRVRPLVAGAGSAYVEDVTRDGHTLLFRREQGLWTKRIGRGAARKLTELPDDSSTNGVFSSDGRKVAAFIEADGREQLSSVDVRSRGVTRLAAGFIPDEESAGGGVVTEIGPVIAWQPVRR